jgi:hypothetical protein
MKLTSTRRAGGGPISEKLRAAIQGRVLAQAGFTGICCTLDPRLRGTPARGTA